jgi:hypothetical protein
MLETMNLLTLRLALKQPSALRRFPGETFRAYMSLVKQDLLKVCSERRNPLHLGFLR